MVTIEPICTVPKWSPPQPLRRWARLLSFSMLSFGGFLAECLPCFCVLSKSRHQTCSRGPKLHPSLEQGFRKFTFSYILPWCRHWPYKLHALLTKLNVNWLLSICKGFIHLVTLLNILSLSGISMGKQARWRSLLGRVSPSSLQHWIPVSSSPRTVGVWVMSWSTNWPHCISINVYLSLSLWWFMLKELLIRARSPIQLN